MFVNIVMKAQKEYTCWVCRGTISPGSKYYCAGGTTQTSNNWVSGRRFCTRCTEVSELITGEEATRQYLQDNTEPCEGLPVMFRKTTKPVNAFKKLIYRSAIRINNDQMYFRTEAIANLILPKGTTIFSDVRYKDKHLRKVRVDQALVHSIFAVQRDREIVRSRMEGKIGFVPAGTREVEEAYSPNSSQVLKYKVGHLMLPLNPFSTAAVQCASGIHLYLSLRDACEHQIR